MKGRPWYKRFPADFLNGVVGLGPDTIGCYAVVLEMIYDRGGPAPNDARHIGGILGCSPRLARSLIERLIECGKLFEAPGGLTNGRAEAVLTTMKKDARKLAENGSKGGRKRAVNAGETIHLNEIAQARLKHRAGVIFQKEENNLLGQSTALAKNGSSGRSPASASEPIAVSPALAAKFTAPKKRSDPFDDSDLEIPSTLRRS